MKFKIYMFWIVLAILIAIGFVVAQNALGLNIFQEGVSASSGISVMGVG